MKRLLAVALLAALTTPAVYALHINAVKDLMRSAHRMVPEVSPIDLKAMIDNDEDFVLLDIREPDQVQHGEIYNMTTVNITRGYLEFKIEPVVPDSKTPIVVYCCTGKRSILAAQRLKEMGYQNVKSLEGGIQKWVEMGLPLFTSYGEMIMMPYDYDAEAVYKEKVAEKEAAEKRAAEKAAAKKKTEKK